MNLHTFSYALPNFIVDELDGPILLRELESTLQKMKNNKAPGFDGIPVEFYKNGTEQLKNYLLLYFNRLYNESHVPNNLNKAVIFAIYKSGDVNQPENYRGISILSSLRKIFTSILYERLTNWVEDKNLLSMFQAGFRAGYSTLDHIFALTSIAKKCIDKKKKLYACFVDFKAAFDKVNRQALLYKLSMLGISRKFLQLYFNFLISSTASVWDGSHLSDWFETTTGVPQGCILSPILFALFIDDISDVLPGGISFADIQVKVLLYADDLVLLAENPFTLQLQINRLNTFCEKWGLAINTSKTKVMIFETRQRRRLPEENWQLNNIAIEVVQEFKYLGVLITHNLNFAKHVKNKSNEAKLALSIMWPKFFANQEIDLLSKYRVFRATVNTCMCYGTPVFGHTYIEAFEAVQRYFFKRLFRLPNSTPNYAIYVESGLSPLYIENLKSNSDYLIRVMRRSGRSLHKSIMVRLLQTRASPFKDWNELALAHGTNLPLSETNVDEWPVLFANVIAKIDEKIYTQHLSRANETTSRNMYKNLNHQLPSEANYFCTEFSAEAISYIFRARVELLNLNFMPHRADLSQICELCNRRENEDTIHFIAICPMLQEIRRLYFESSHLTLNRLYEILNGAIGWSTLYKYCKHALAYRNSYVT